MIMHREFNTNMPSSIIGVVIRYCFCNDKTLARPTSPPWESNVLLYVNFMSEINRSNSCWTIFCTILSTKMHMCLCSHYYPRFVSSPAGYHSCIQGRSKQFFGDWLVKWQVPYHTNVFFVRRYHAHESIQVLTIHSLTCESVSSLTYQYHK